MLDGLQSLLAPAFAERLTLVINHVLGSEAMATARLQPHAGRSVLLSLDAWPALLPAPPVLAWRVTPAGLLQWCGNELPPAPATHDLTVRVDAANPALLLARALGGTPPAMQIDGDAQLAADFDWLLQNLRWDVAADLERLFGPAVAQQLHLAGTAVARALRAAIKGAVELGGRLRSRGA